MNEEDEWPYWKAAISCLPTREMRDAAWEFFVRHLAQNPKMADTFSGVILVMQANGHYMLKVPKLVHDEALVPLGREVSRLRDEMAETVSRHAEVTKDTFAVCEKTRQVAEAAAMAAKELDGAIRDGWREVNTEKLAARIQGELETAVLRPLAAQCGRVEEMTPALKDAADQLEESARKLRAFHFKGILGVMLAACLLVMGGCFSFGWWKLSPHYDRMVNAALKRILSVQADNQEAFTRLIKLNAPIRVVPVTDSRRQVIPGKFALVMEHAEDVGIEDTPDGKRVAIYFEKAPY
ncbi:MAG: hypothetical protein WBW78_10560 [Terrimicrobiaceae bacterium]